MPVATASRGRTVPLCGMLTRRNGSRPFRISQAPSRSIPRFFDCFMATSAGDEAARSVRYSEAARPGSVATTRSQGVGTRAPAHLRSTHSQAVQRRVHVVSRREKERSAEADLISCLELLPGDAGHALPAGTAGLLGAPATAVVLPPALVALTVVLPVVAPHPAPRAGLASLLHRHAQPPCLLAVLSDRPSRR